jgi:hypothetical protein
MAGSEKYLVEVEDKESRDRLFRVVETPFGEYKAAAVAILALRDVAPNLHYGRITVKEWVPGDLDDPHRTVVDPWAEALGEE